MDTDFTTERDGPETKNDLGVFNYNIACPLTCELTPPGTFAGVLEKKKKYLPVSLHFAASPSRSSISPRGMPHSAKMYSWRWYASWVGLQHVLVRMNGLLERVRVVLTMLQKQGHHPRHWRNSSHGANLGFSPPVQDLRSAVRFHPRRLRAS